MKPRRRPIPRMSQARKQRDKELKRVASVLWRELWHQCETLDICCQWPGCTEPADPHPHHVIERALRPDLVCDPLNLVFLCWSEHHSKLKSTLRAEAFKMGFLGRSTDDLEELARLRAKFTKQEEKK